MSINANTPNPDPPEKAGGGIVLTKQQVTAILIGAVLLLIFLVAALAFLLFDNQRSISGSFPTLAPVNSPSPIAPVPAVSVPTYAYRPTITPIPTHTPFAFRATTPVPNTNPGIGQPTQQSGYSSNCQAQLDYAASVHQYNVNYYKSYYQPWIDYYQSLINQAAQTRDALALVQAQNALDQVKSQLQSALSDENSRYKKEVAGIKASC